MDQSIPRDEDEPIYLVRVRMWGELTRSVVNVSLCSDGPVCLPTPILVTPNINPIISLSPWNYDCMLLLQILDAYVYLHHDILSKYVIEYD